MERWIFIKEYYKWLQQFSFCEDDFSHKESNENI